MLSPNATPEQIDRWNLLCYRELASSRGVHLVALYGLIVGVALGIVIEHFCKL
jgi:hypothetical protein